MHETPLEERQLDIKLLLDQYQQILISLTTKKEACLATLIEGIALLSRYIYSIHRKTELKDSVPFNPLILINAKEKGFHTRQCLKAPFPFFSKNILYLKYDYHRV